MKKYVLHTPTPEDFNRAIRKFQEAGFNVTDVDIALFLYVNSIFAGSITPEDTLYHAVTRVNQGYEILPPNFNPLTLDGAKPKAKIEIDGEFWSKKALRQAIKIKRKFEKCLEDK